MYAQIQAEYTHSLMLLAAGYFDESTDGEFEDRVFTVGGYIANGYVAVQLDFKWKELLGKYDLAFFKASELESGIGEFAKFRDSPDTASVDRFTEREKTLFREIKTEFVDLLCKQTDLIAISATVHMRHLKAFAYDCPELAARLPSVYQLCGQLVMIRSGLLMNETNEGNPFAYQSLLKPVFDSHQEYGARFEASFDLFTQKNQESSRYLLPPMFENEKDYRCLQAADLLVYEIRRTISNYFFEPKRDLRIAMKRLFPQAMTTYVLDYDALKLIASCQVEDNIPIDAL